MPASPGLFQERIEKKSPRFFPALNFWVKEKGRWVPTGEVAFLTWLEPVSTVIGVTGTDFEIGEGAYNSSTNRGLHGGLTRALSPRLSHSEMLSCPTWKRLQVTQRGGKDIYQGAQEAGPSRKGRTSIRYIMQAHRWSVAPPQAQTTSKPTQDCAG